MNLLRSREFLPAVGLGLLFWFTAPTTTFAQGISSGSGSGTGTGRESGGAGATGTGAEAGGLGATSGRPSSFPPLLNLDPRLERGGPRPDPMLVPRITIPESARGTFTTEENALVRDALAITDPGERSLALVRLARSSIFLGRPDLGHNAIFRGAEDSLRETNPTIRDQRLTNVIIGALALAEEHMREIAVAQASPDVIPVLPAPKNIDRKSNLERGRSEWQLAYELAFQIRNRSARTENLYRIVESESLGSSVLVRESFRLSQVRPDPTKIPPLTRDFADQFLVLAIKQAMTIERPALRDRALVAIASNAAASGQFDRAIEAARSIPQPEVRTDGFLKIAENEAVFGQQEAATLAYSEAAKAISMVPNADPREILVGVLIDSLIAFGRFDDARASVVLYSNPANPPIALAAVAESQGKRNRAESAREWIAKEPSAELRSLLYRKLNDGVLASEEQKRAAALAR